MTHRQAIVVATIRARRTGIRQAVKLCPCDGGNSMPTPHFVVRAVDRIPAAAL